MRLVLNIKIRIWAKNVQIKNNYLVIFEKFSKHETIFNIEATLYQSYDTKFFFYVHASSCVFNSSTSSYPTFENFNQFTPRKVAMINIIAQLFYVSLLKNKQIYVEISKKSLSLVSHNIAQYLE